MDCRIIEDKLVEGVRDAEVEGHVRLCPTCAELAESGLAELLAHPEPDESELSLDLSDNALASMQAELTETLTKDEGLFGRLRALSTEHRRQVAFVVAAVTVLGVLAATPRVDLWFYPRLRMTLALGLMIVGLMWALAATLRPVHVARLSRGAAVTLIAAAVVIPLWLAALPPAHGFHPASLTGLGDELVGAAAKCFAFGAVLSLPLLLGLWALDRTAHRSVRRLLFAAGAAGLLANLVLQLHCPIVFQEHLLAGHASVGVAFVVAYGVFWWVRARRRRPSA